MMFLSVGIYGKRLKTFYRVAYAKINRNAKKNVQRNDSVRHNMLERVWKIGRERIKYCMLEKMQTGRNKKRRSKWIVPACQKSLRDC